MARKPFLGQRRRRLWDILVFVFRLVVENEAIRCVLELTVKNCDRGLENARDHSTCCTLAIIVSLCQIAAPADAILFLRNCPFAFEKSSVTSIPVLRNHFRLLIFYFHSF